MKNWLRRKLRDFLDGDRFAIMAAESSLKVDHSEMDTEVIRFTLTPAVGGRILRVTRDSRFQAKSGLSIGGSSPQETVTYIIPTNEDIGDRVAKIINLEMIK